MVEYKDFGNGLFMRVYTKQELLRLIGNKKSEIEGLKELEEDTSNAETELEGLKAKYKEL